jgi:ubiquinone/menaquinone biosynthesis C-methylase UbiE
MPDQRNLVRESYDRIAEEYARRIAGELQHKPLDRQLLDRFATLVRPQGQVCDMGCGPGHVALYLNHAGLSVCGLDLSPAMVEQARKLNPSIDFRQGDMFSLQFANSSLAGIAAFYAIVNIPEDSLPAVFAEMSRVLEPAGILFLGFHAGDQILREEELWGYPIAMDFFFFDPKKIAKLLEGAGLVVDEILERDPYPEVEYQSRRAYIFAHKR